MRTKIAIAVTTALLSGVSGSLLAAPFDTSSFIVSKPANINYKIQHVDNKQPSKQKLSNHAVFTPEANLPNTKKYRYFVRLIESPVALYGGGIQQFKATMPASINGKSNKLDVNSKPVKDYQNYLQHRQSNIINKATALIGSVDIKQQTTLQLITVHYTSCLALISFLYLPTFPEPRGQLRSQRSSPAAECSLQGRLQQIAPTETLRVRKCSHKAGTRCPLRTRLPLHNTTS